MRIARHEFVGQSVWFSILVISSSDLATLLLLVLSATALLALASLSLLAISPSTLANPLLLFLSSAALLALASPAVSVAVTALDAVATGYCTTYPSLCMSLSTCASSSTNKHLEIGGGW